MALTKEDLDAINSLFIGRFDSLDSRVEHMENHMEHMDSRMEHMENRMERVEYDISTMGSRMDKLEGEMASMNGKIGELGFTVSTMEKKLLNRMDAVEDKMFDVSKKVNSLAEKTEIFL